VESEKASSPSSAQQTPAPVAQPLAAWFARLGLSGRILGIAALLGIIAAFLPAMTIDAPALKGLSKATPSLGSAMVVDDWRGKISLLGFAGALVLVFVLYPAGGLAQKSLCWVGVGLGALVALLGLWLLVTVLNGPDLAFLGVKFSPGIGLFVSLFAGIGVAVGAFFKVREEKLI
jgi:hypothetical protein